MLETFCFIILMSKITFREKRVYCLKCRNGMMKNEMYTFYARFDQPVDLTLFDLTEIMFTCLHMFTNEPRFFSDFLKHRYS